MTLLAAAHAAIEAVCAAIEAVCAASVEVCGGPVSGVSSARGQWQQRQGLLLRLRDRAGHEGLGEASPLPGYSPDTLEACRAELAAVAAALPGAAAKAAKATNAANAANAANAGPATPAADGLHALLDSVIGRVRAPAARFALETALLDLLGQRTGQPLWQCLRAGDEYAGSGHAAPVALNAVCTATDAGEVLAQVDRARARGIDCVKLKVGRDLAREMAILEAVRAAHGNAVILRVDANQAWTPAQARAALARLAAVAPAYVEEPLAMPAACTPQDLAEHLANHLDALAPLPVPVALDESLAHLDTSAIDDLLASGRIAALVLKPMLLGGFQPCLALAARARRRGAAVVISHLFDGPVALAACAHLAVALGAGHACGLDRHPGLAAWPAIDIPYLHADRITPPATPGLGVTWSARP